VATVTSFLFCTSCNHPLPEDSWNTAEMVSCVVCGTRFRALAFPALLQRTAAVRAEVSRIEGEATCFYHSRKKAVTPCDRCGRFLCALCEIEFEGERWCPACLKSGQGKGAVRALETNRTNYDSMALVLATLPSIAIWPSLISCPIAIYIAIRHWRAPGSILPRTRIRYYLALFFATIQIVAWIWLFAYLWAVRTR
jgi:hypothetical protein